MKQKADIGLIGLAVMGENLVLNMESKGFTVAVFNRTVEKVDHFISGRGAGKNFIGAHSIEELCNSLERPRKVMMLVKAGKAVDDFIDLLIPHLEEGDIIIDGGNSHFPDTIRRTKYVESKGLLYIGTGVSGGEEGALLGPSMMPGGSPAAWPAVKDIFQAVAAKVEGDVPCCDWVGEDGAGHFVKMVHNGIEYADMQLIAEAYLLLKHVGGYENSQIADIFNEWNQGELNSFLIGITADIFKEKDDLGEGELVDKILDSAGQKGTGRWTSLAALEQGVNTSIMTSACNARNISSFYEKRQQLAESGLKKVLPVEIDADFVEDVRRSLYTAKIAAYAQGLALYKSASETYDWNLNLGDIASIFRAGCIIQARFLNNITNAYQQEPNLDNLIENEFFAEKVKNNQQCLRKIVAKAILAGVPVPAFANAISYIDGLSTKVVGANLIQAQRDYFGAHTYKRIDREGSFHHQWQKHFDR